MLYLQNDNLVFDFPEVHSSARLTVGLFSNFTLKIAGKVRVDRNTQIPLSRVEAHADRLPETLLKRGGVLAPVRPNQAIRLFMHGGYPWAVKIGSGKVNLISNTPWQNHLDPETRDYVDTNSHLRHESYLAPIDFGEK